MAGEAGWILGELSIVVNSHAHPVLPGYEYAHGSFNANRLTSCQSVVQVGRHQDAIDIFL
jgi:hypothetical protein